MKIKISSRKSPLAQIQSFQVGETLQSAHAGLEVDYHFRQSLGDQNQNDPLWKMPEKGVFTEDFYADLVNGETDMVVHSWKDLPTEGKKDTRVAATLARADQRDLLLFKKTSMGKAQVKCFSSSPRRAFNLKDFLMTAFPWKAESVEFLNVRGNITTRVQKLMADSEVDGLIVAKAAFDRLLTDRKFPETRDHLRSVLSDVQWMVLPLSENPNAAAQGALAIEVAHHNDKALKLVEKINCHDSFVCADREREILKAFGGGCHLAIGVSVLERPYGRIEIVKGMTPAGEKLKTKRLLQKKVLPAGLKVERLEFQSERTAIPFQVPDNTEAIFVSRVDAANKRFKGKLLWAAGVQTWTKLAAQGYWVNGCAEGLGEQEDPRIEVLAGKSLEWCYLTHDGVLEASKPHRVGTYHLNLSLKSVSLPEAQVFRWKSSSEFQLAIQKFPELKKYSHLCGPGRSFEMIKETLGSVEKIYVELNDELISII